MFIAAFVAAQHDPDARAYYLRKRGEDKRHNAAVICVARRRPNIILAMLKTRTPYQPREADTSAYEAFAAGRQDALQVLTELSSYASASILQRMAVVLLLITHKDTPCPSEWPI